MRKPMITRTITSTAVTVYAIEGESLVRKTYVVPTDLKQNQKRALKLLQKQYPNDDIVKVDSMAVDENLYGMPMDEFMKYARPMASYFETAETESDDAETAGTYGENVTK